MQELIVAIAWIIMIINLLIFCLVISEESIKLFLLFVRDIIRMFLGKQEMFSNKENEIANSKYQIKRYFRLCLPGFIFSFVFLFLRCII